MKYDIIQNYLHVMIIILDIKFLQCFIVFVSVFPVLAHYYRPETNEFLSIIFFHIEYAHNECVTL